MATNHQVYNITQYLPHRKPMLLVDIITEISQEHVVTSYHIPEHSIFLHNNIFQESGVIENMAQTCSAIVGQNYFNPEIATENIKTNVIGFISGIKKVEFFALPNQGEQLKTAAELISRFEGEDYSLCTMNATCFCDAQKIATATLNLFLQKTE
ncbi:ABC transporter permease [Flavobacterium agricola]|uniref:ABC transporter permease n=1 Tax=Flavobacterium agricola TaxID=2870839 RepID=A0ABY6LZL3_9FLAO|nr:ABC transporter permease [Flavobacterium agricola]UYW01002.1 ABC transporter permease [Flavobacterium agricola]